MRRGEGGVIRLPRRFGFRFRCILSLSLGEGLPLSFFLFHFLFFTLHLHFFIFTFHFQILSCLPISPIHPSAVVHPISFTTYTSPIFGVLPSHSLIPRSKPSHPRSNLAISPHIYFHIALDHFRSSLIHLFGIIVLPITFFTYPTLLSPLAS
jgi:hypothetical protein